MLDHVRKPKAVIDLVRAFGPGEPSYLLTGETVPTSGPPKEAWRNCCCGVVLSGNEADIAYSETRELSGGSGAANLKQDRPIPDAAERCVPISRSAAQEF